MGGKNLEKSTGRKLWIDDQMLNKLLNQIQQAIGLPLVSKHLVTAEKTVQAMESRKSLYESFDRCGFEIDVRTFKGKQAFCPNK